MSSDGTGKLVMMANQIARAFEGQHDDAAHAAAAHIKSFWTPPMREAVIRHMEDGGQDLSPTARLALAELAASDRPSAPQA